jgi:hypothetical protein
VAGGGGITGARQNGATEHETKRKRYQNKERSKRISPSCSKRKERRQRRRSMARAELQLGFLVRRRAVRGRAWVSSVVWRGARGVPFIGLEGGEEGALEAVDGHRRAADIEARWSSWWRFGEVEARGWSECVLGHLLLASVGEGGRPRGVGEVVASAAMAAGERLGAVGGGR